MIMVKNKNTPNDIIIEDILNNLKRIYSNKSCDEYKFKGDITASPKYSNIEYMIANLSIMKRFPKNDATTLKTLFNTLHRPMFKKMITEYMTEPNEKNVIFTGTFTVGYRLLVGELGRIYASAEATNDGYIYKPDRISKNASAMLFIKKYSTDMENKIDAEIRRISKKTISVQEATVVEALGGVANATLATLEGFLVFINSIFRTATSLNPVSLISAVLSRSYDKKVEKYDEISTLYMSSKQAYDEYMKIPQNQRKSRIEHRYVRMIEKYNIKMNNIKAQLDHFDMRSMEEHKDSIANPKRKGISSFFKKKDKPTTTTEDDSKTEDKSNEEPKETGNNAQNVDNNSEDDDDFDF